MLKDELEKKEELLENEEVKEEVVEEPTEEIKNIDLTVFNKKKFSVNGDPNKIIELDVSDLGVVTRINDQYPLLQKLSDKVGNLSSKVEGLNEVDMLSVTSKELKEIDAEMRKAVDTIFDYPVSKVCVPTGSMYDPIGGRLRYEHLVDTLIKLYDENLNSEIKKIQARVSKHTAKYSKKK